MNNNLLPFVTGSRAYGTPNEDSDLDVVMLVPCDLMMTLWGLNTSKALRYGRMNIIALNASNPDDCAKFEVWRRVTNELIAERPVSRDAAIARFAQNGIEPHDYPEDKDSQQ